MKEELSKKTKKEIAGRLQKIRVDMGMKKTEFSKLVGVSNQYYSTVESGENCLAIDRIINLCRLTGQSADYILLGKISNIDEDTLKLLSGFKEKDVDKIFCIIKQVMILINNNKDPFKT